MKNHSILTAAAVFCFLCGDWQVHAHPYASGITNQSGAVSWVLNEAATDVQLIFDNGSVTNDLGSTPVVGTNTFNFAGHTNFVIVVYKIGTNAITQISSDANVNNSFGGPRGVVVNTNAKTGNFGRIYVANANPLPANARATTSKGIYVMDAASGDFLGLGNTAATGGMSLGTSTTYSPFKLGLGPDDALYVGDAATGTIGGVWRMDPNLATSASVFNLVSVSTVDKATSGTNFGRAVGTPNITGSLAAGNLKLILTMWDLNLVNPPGTYGSSAVNYQDIYQYNINSGPLPWKTYPTVVTNPIGIGTVNVVTMDGQIAPDGKYFITAFRFNPADGSTNVCVLGANGALLWDSRSQSQSYFNDSTRDHLDFADTSISISPDDKYVLIQGSTNMNFLLMALTNGVPDISTLTTNNPAHDTGGTLSYASTWDAADNIYVTSGGSGYLRVFSLGLTTTCTTSNDATFTNGSFKMSAISGQSAAIQTQPTNQTAQCSGNASFSVVAGGQSDAYQWYQVGHGAIGGATNATLTLTNVSVAQSGNSYQVVVSNFINSVTSQTATLTVIDTIPPVVTLLGNATTNIPQNSAFVDPGATASDACAGTLPVSTNGAVNTSVPGTYVLGYTATDPSGNSATNFRTVNVSATNAPPGITQQPANPSTSCGGNAIFTVTASGANPLAYQWYLGATALSNGITVSGATSSSLTLVDVSLGQSGGSYKVTVTNAFGVTNSQAATLTVTDTNRPVITLLGGQTMSVAVGSPFIDPGATASDPCAGSLAVNISGAVNTNTVGTYTLNYSATGPGGVSATNTRTVDVDAEALPAIWTQFPGSPVGDGSGGDNTRSDDIYFANQTTGWATRDTEILKTTDSGNTWNIVFISPTNAHFRSIGFLTPTHGFAGNLGFGSYDGAVVDTNVLYETFDAGASWHVFQGLSQQGMKGFCAMQVYDTNTIFGAGRVRGPAFFVKSTNGGTNFTVVNLTAAGVMNGIMDVHFSDLTNGWVVGMDTNAYSSSCSPAYHGCIAHTTNGGLNWTSVLTTPLSCCYFWKMAWPTPQVGYVSLQQNGTINNIIFYKTTNAGQTWVSNSIPISVADGCAFYLQGIGFSDTNTGWMGGATCATYQDSFIQTTDGGTTWTPVGYYDTTHMNRLRFTATNFGYACGFALHQYAPPVAITNPPSSQIVSNGQMAQFQAGVFSSGGPASYQWLWNGTAIAGATTSSFTLTNAGRTNEGGYAVVVSNSYGTVISSNATLQVTVPQLLFRPLLLPGGGVKVGFGDSDGSPLSSNDLLNFVLYGSSNLSNWLPYSLPYVLTNGIIQVSDPTNYPARFYKVVEH